MTTPFVAQLRVGTPALVIGQDGEHRITVRVEVPEVWDAVRVDLPPATSVRELKQRALSSLVPDEPFPEQYVVKLHGFEVLDENASVTEVGGVNGSIFLVTNRRRRPVKG